MTHHDPLRPAPRTLLRGAAAELLTCAEAADALGVRESTIRAWLLSRQIAAVRLSGRCVRVPRAEIVRLIAAGTTPALPARGGRP